jgi:hypothetical protein
MFCMTPCVPCAASCTLWAISLVDPRCCSTAVEIFLAISLIWPMVAPISRMASAVVPVALRIESI